MLSLLRSIPTRVILLVVLLATAGGSFYVYQIANSQNPVILKGGNTYYTPGQHRNCKWVLHVSNTITTFPGETSSVQIGIPDVIKDGYISGILQSGHGNSLLLVFSYPGRNASPPIIMTSSYDIKDLPLETITFRVFSSTAMSMTIYPTYDACIEATMQ
jgi:hypothetical protein